MSAKCLDQQGRWRNKVVAFRMSPEEDELLETAVRLSGLTKQEYIIRRLQEKEVVVTGNPRVYKALKKELEKVLSELKRLKKGEDVPEDLLEVIRLTPGCRKQEKAARTQTRAATTAADNKAPRQKQEATKRADWPEAPERKEGGLSYGVYKDSNGQKNVQRRILPRRI